MKSNKVFIRINHINPIILLNDLRIPSFLLSLICTLKTLDIAVSIESFAVKNM